MKGAREGHPALKIFIMINDNVKSETPMRLRQAEIEHSMRILYACESGSRAWGFSGRPDILDSRAIRQGLNEVFRVSVRMEP